ncbi:hypothetical protein F5884DRAFT_875853 [Xylogone sp. PMI_703]|nr:hypothetical protein F5884DRAFT_875853 [Xylogone sp. PMI_703]
MATKLITVFGATGNQGGSVIRAILEDPTLSKEFRIRGITRDTNKETAKELAVKGCGNYLKVSQGKIVTDASKHSGVKHLIFSSLLNTTEISKGRLSHISHFDGKAEIEQYIRDSGVPATFVLPGVFMSGMFAMIKKQEDGSYKLTLPVSSEKAKFPLIDAANDTGKFVKAAIKRYPSCLNERVYAATDYYTPSRLVSEFSEVTGKPATAVQVPEDTFKSFLPPNVAQELLENMLLLEDPGYYAGADLTESLKLVEEKPTTWKEFVAKNKAKWL